MTTFYVTKDYEKPRHAGADGLFQVITLRDENEKDVTDKIDVGIFFRNNDHLKGYLSAIFDIIDIAEL